MTGDMSIRHLRPGLTSATGCKGHSFLMTSWKQQLARLFAMHKGHVEQIAFRRVRDREVAADIVQTAFTKLLASGGRESEEENTKILFTAVRNESSNYLTGSMRRSNILSGLTLEQMFRQQPSSQDAMESAQAMTALEEALGALPERTRHIFIRRRVHGESNAVIAADLGISVRAVEKHLVRAMEHCRSAVEDYFLP
ncbi:sigma-70 family RNA polymerase sigma factor [uncultured Martelella sp.]|uniref:sigma-70 family RNA polymerase sigma factor n=1 Tax=uncultured Martelella sp. TaxID=392331 RepID=UPI0029C62387|nr:sigma-70 family RNA polymerase sigma factor [uncultured Martelella sp.]